MLFQTLITTLIVVHLSLKVGQRWPRPRDTGADEGEKTASAREHGGIAPADDDLETRDTKRLRQTSFQPKIIDSKLTPAVHHTTTHSVFQESSMGYFDHDMHVLGRAPR